MQKWYVGKSSIAGQGVFALLPIQAGENIDISFNYFIIDGERYPYITEFGSWVNHSWKPNTSVEYDSKNGVYYIQARRYIPVDTEITADYRESPEFIEGPEDWYV